jgi:hypothetical protein
MSGKRTSLKSSESETLNGQENFSTERVGFEPTEPFGSPDFKSGAFDHSATSPGA